MSKLYKLNHDGTVAVDPFVSYYPMDSCPQDCIVQLHTKGGVHTKGVIRSPEDLANYQGWRGVPSGVKNVE